MAQTPFERAALLYKKFSPQTCAPPLPRARARAASNLAAVRATMFVTKRRDNDDNDDDDYGRGVGTSGDADTGAPDDDDEPALADSMDSMDTQDADMSGGDEEEKSAVVDEGSVSMQALLRVAILGDKASDVAPFSALQQQIRLLYSGDGGEIERDESSERRRLIEMACNASEARRTAPTSLSLFDKDGKQCGTIDCEKESLALALYAVNALVHVNAFTLRYVKSCYGDDDCLDELAERSCADTQLCDTLSSLLNAYFDLVGRVFALSVPMCYF